MTTLRIVILSLHTSPLDQPGIGDAGGMNVYVHQMARAMGALGHHVVVVTRARTSTEAQVATVIPGTRVAVKAVEAGGFEPRTKERLPEVLGEFVAATAREIDADGADEHPLIIYSHYWLSGVAALKLKEHHVPHATLIHTMHTTAAAKNRARPGSEPKSREDAEGLIVDSVDLITANTEVERRELIQDYNADPQRIVEITPGVDHTVFSPTGRALWLGDEADLKVLFAGRIQEHKGPHILVQALQEIAQRTQRHHRTPRVHVHFAGAQSGADSLDLQELAKNLGVASQVTMSEPSSAEHLANLMRGADIVAMPSASESFGLVAAEAQACGTPVIAHATGGLVKAVADGVSGFLLPTLEPTTWASALWELAELPATDWQQLSLAAKTHAQQFRWEASAARLVRVLNKTRHF